MVKTHDNLFIQNPIHINNIKTQFSLAISKPSSCWQYLKLNFHWQHQNPIFIGTTLSKRKESKIINARQRKKDYVKMLPWQKRTMAIILWRNSLRAILRIMFSFYKPVKYMYIICITTSIICTFNTHGKHSNPQDHHLSYYAIIRNLEHYCNMEFIKVNIIYKSILKLVLLFQTLQLIAQRPITSIYEKPKNIY